MFRRTVLCFAIALVALSSSEAFAGSGGGGGKRDASVRFRNNSNEVVAVIAAETAQQVQSALQASLVAGAPTQGVVLVNPGATSSAMKFRAGTVFYGVADPTATDSSGVVQGSTSLTARGSKTIVINNPATAGGAPTVTVQ